MLQGVRRRSVLERLRARWITGPPGHLQAGLADAGQLLLVLARARLRARFDARRAERRGTGS